MKVCPICGDQGRQLLEAHAMDVVSSKEMHYARCSACNIVYFSDEIGVDNVDYSESGYYQTQKPRVSYFIEIMMNIFMVTRLSFLKSCSETLKGKTVLDIGCGKGRFLCCAQKAGMKILGVEPTKRSYIVAKDRLGDLISNSVMESGIFPQNSVDIITMWHVFEHIPDPVSMLNTCKEILRPKGCLVIAVPNFDGWIARFGGKVWFNLDPPRHVVHYTPETLANLLESNGFGVVYISHYYPELTYFSALQTILNKMLISPNFLFNLLKRNKKAMPKSKIKVVINALFTFIFGVFFFPVALFFVPLTTLLHKSDCITVIGKRLD